MLRICHNYSQNVYEMPKGETDEMRVNNVNELEAELGRMRDLMIQSKATLRDYLLTA